MDNPDRDRCRELTPARRNNYFTGKLMTEKDFQDEQSYFGGKGRQHNRYLHGYGVVCGLRVLPFEPPQPDRVVVEPGLALDPWGREIVVAEPAEFDLGERGCLDAIVPGRSRSVYLVVEYHEEGADWVPRPGMGEPGLENNAVPSRIIETFHLSLRPEPPELDDDVDRQLCEGLATAIREKADAERLHALLCELLTRPCRPCAPDPALTLARIDLPTRGPITAAQIDNCSHRRLALSAEQLLRIFLCMIANLGNWS
jgi:hypothetical protein